MANMPKISESEARTYLKSCRPGLILGRWIGGGFGDVYTVYGTDEAMVVKILDTRQIVAAKRVSAMVKDQRRAVKKRLQEEVKIMSELESCRHVMPLRDSCRIEPAEDSPLGTKDRSAFVLLLFMPELTPLSEFMGNKPMDEKSVLQMLLDISSALSVCADHQITHFDLKPDNIFVCKGKDRLYYVLGDFDTAQRDGAWNGNQRIREYSPYRAPECFSETTAPGRNADIYSLGVVAYQCLTQTCPYPQNAADTDLRPPVISNISRALFDVLELMLQRDPAKRCDHPKRLEERLREIPVQSPRPANRQEYAEKVRKLILENDLNAAIRVAAEGKRKKEPSCVRLMAMAVSKQKAMGAARFQSAKAIIAEQCLEEDMASIFLRGFFSGMMKDWRGFVRDLKLSAEAGFVPACYLYGRTLLYGDDRAECPVDPDQGMQYLIRAAEADYFPAIRLVQREGELYPQMRMSSELRRKLMAEEYRSDDPREREALYHWL